MAKPPITAAMPDEHRMASLADTAAAGMPTSACSMRNSDIVKPMPASIPTVTRCLPFMPLGNAQIPALTAP